MQGYTSPTLAIIMELAQVQAGMGFRVPGHTGLHQPHPMLAIIMELAQVREGILAQVQEGILAQESWLGCRRESWTSGFMGSATDGG